MKPVRRYAVEYEVPGRGKFVLAAGTRASLKAHARRLGLHDPLDRNIVLVEIRPRQSRAAG